MEQKWFERVLIFGAIIGLALFVFAATAHAAPTVCQIGNGCTGTSTAPAYGNILIGGKNGEYEYVASSTLGGGSGGSVGFSTTSAAYWFTQQTTSGLAEGSNLYFTNARAVAALTGQNISLFANNVGYLTSLAGAASSTLLSDNNTFSGTNVFSNALSNFAGTWQGFSPSHFLTGNQTVTLSGDVTGSGATAITTAIGSNAVTYSKFQQVSANSLVGNPTGSTGNAQAISTSSLGLTTSAFASSNISQWTNNSGYLTSLSGAASSTLLHDNNTFTGRDIFSLINLSATSSAVLGTDSNGNVVATTSIGSNYITGPLGTINNTSLSRGGTITVTAASSTALGDNDTFTGNDTFNNTITGSVSGNAGTATALQNARTINGVSFNGTANIVVSSTTLLASDNNTFAGNTTFAASTTFQKQLNAQQASTTLFTASGSVFLPGLTTGAGNGSLCETTAGQVEYEPGANCVTGSSASSTLLSDNNTFSGNDIFTASTTHSAQTNLQSASSTLFSSSGNTWLDTSGYPQIIFGAPDTSPIANVELNSQSEGSYSSFGMKNGSNESVLTLDTVDEPSGIPNPLILDNITGDATCLQIAGGSFGCLDDYNTYASLFAIISPAYNANGVEAGLTTTMQGANGNDNTDYGVQEYPSTGIDAYQDYWSSSYSQPLQEPDFEFWEETNGSTSNSATAWHWLVATSSPVGTAATTTDVCLGDVGTTTLSAFTNCGQSLGYPTFSIFSTSSRTTALAVYSDTRNSTTTDFQVTNTGTASSTNLIASFLATAPGTYVAADPTGKLIATTTPVVSMTSGTGIACSKNGATFIGSCSFANQPANTVLTNQSSGAGVPTGESTSTFAQNLFNSVNPNLPLVTNDFLYTGATGLVTGTASSSLDLPNVALQHSTITLNSQTLTLGDTNDTITAASSTLLANNNTFSGNNIFTASTTHQAQVNMQQGSSTIFSANTFCLNTCITSWPSGGGSASSTLLSDNNTFSGLNTFSNLLTLTGGVINTASSTQEGNFTFSGSNVNINTNASTQNAAPLTILETSATNASGFVLVNSALTGSERNWVDGNGYLRIDDGSSAQDPIVFNGGGTGNVGIASTTPWATLSVGGPAGSAVPVFAVSTSTSAFATTTVFAIDKNGNTTIGGNGTALTVNGGFSTFASNINLNGNLNLGGTAVTTTDNGNEIIGTNWGWYIKGDSTHLTQIVGGSLMVGYSVGTPGGTTYPTNDILVAGNVGIASSTPWAQLSIGSGAIVVSEASSTGSGYNTVNFQSQQTSKIEMNANTTVNLQDNAPTGEQEKVILCQDTTGSRTVTWLSSSSLVWSGGTAPTQTATAGACDVYSFIVTGATGTPRVFGAATQNFP